MTLRPMCAALLCVTACADLLPPPPPNTDPTVLAQKQSSPQDLALDSRNLYWTVSPPQDNALGPVPGTIQSVSVDGGAVQTLIASTTLPGALAIDDTKLYWLDEASGLQPELMSANLDGSGATQLLAFNDSATAGTRLVLYGRTLYWGGAFGVHRFPLDGGSPDTLFDAKNDAGAYLYGAPGVIAVDDTGLYWTVGSIGFGAVLNRSPLDGSTILTLTSQGTLAALAGIGFAEDRRKAYFFVDGLAAGGTFYEVSVDGPPPDGGPTRVFDYYSNGNPGDVATDGHGVYFCDPSYVGSGVYQVVDGGFTQIWLGNGLSDRPQLIRLDDDFIYFFGGASGFESATLRKIPRSAAVDAGTSDAG